jgi:hypothetical protein
MWGYEAGTLYCTVLTLTKKMSANIGVHFMDNAKRCVVAAVARRDSVVPRVDL